MGDKEKALPGVGAPGKACETATSNRAISSSNFSMDAAGGQVADFLLHGERFAVSAQLLAQVCGFRSTRQLRRAIEAERAAGALILADDSGYFLPSECPEIAAEELKRFIRRTDARLRSNRRSIQGCKRVLRAMERGELSGQMSISAGGERNV